MPTGHNPLRRMSDLGELHPCVRDGASQDLVGECGAVGHPPAGAFCEFRQCVINRHAALLDETIGEQQEDVTRLQTYAVFREVGFGIGTEQQSCWWLQCPGPMSRDITDG
jgi:hypothetical protein